jgi:dihydrodipicolinate synthase/N-acetylneuraminate lyase
MERCFKLQLDAGVDGFMILPGVPYRSLPEETLAHYRTVAPLLALDVSAQLVQNIKLVEALVIGSNDRCRAPPSPASAASMSRLS